MRFHSFALLSLLTTFATVNVVAVQQKQKNALRRGNDDESSSNIDSSKEGELKSLRKEFLSFPSGGISSSSSTGMDYQQMIERHLKESPTKRIIISYPEGSKSKCLHSLAMADQARTINQAMTTVKHNFDELNAIVVEADADVIEDMKRSEPEFVFEEDPPRFPMKGGEKKINQHSLPAALARKLVETPYGIDMVGAPQAWDMGHTGAGVKVCVIDSGFDENHPAFEEGNISGIDTSIAWNSDGCGHGTHVAGTIAGKDVGVAPDAEIVVVRIFNDDCGIAFSSRIYEAARQCKEKGANIVSMSLGGPLPSWIEYQGFKNLYEDNVLSIAAAGNGGNGWWSYPASYTGVMSVAAIDESMEHAPFSQTNRQIDIAAPGVDVYSTFPVGGCLICGNDADGYGSISGTSMATPHVSGVAALVWGAFPTKTAAQILDALEQSALDLGDEDKDKTFGSGLVQAPAAIQYLGGASGFDADNSNAGSDGDNVGGTGICQDDPPGWHDSDGDEYNCAFYATGTNCAEYGDGFANNGVTANDACCACGGGTTPSYECTDTPGWHDSEGETFDCEWYAEKQNCFHYGDQYSNNGMTANQACCVCKSL